MAQRSTYVETVKKVLALLLVILAFDSLAEAKKRSYQRGILIDVVPKYIESPAPLGGDLFPAQILVGYSFEIQVGDFTYFVNAALCCPLRSKYKLEWTVSDPIEFRFDKRKMFVKRPNGKELQAGLVKVVQGAAQPLLSPPARPAGPVFPKIPQGAEHGKPLLLGMDFFRADDVCLFLFANMNAGDFFESLRSRKTPDGTEFRKGSQPVKTYPDSVTVRVIAEVGTCTAKQRTLEGGNLPKNIALDEDFMRSVTFEGAWKHGFDERVAVLGPFAEGRIPNPTPLIVDGDWWQYEFHVRSKDVSLNDALVIILQSPDGRMVARFSARLPSTVTA